MEKNQKGYFRADDESKSKRSYVKLSDGCSSALGGRYRFNLHYLNGVWSGAMLGTHVTVALCDGTFVCQVSVFSVHVVCTGSRVVSQPNAKVFDFEWLSFVDLARARQKKCVFLQQKKSEEQKRRGVIPTWSHATTSPWAFLTFFKNRMKYQNLLLAWTVLGAKIFIW